MFLQSVGRWHGSCAEGSIAAKCSTEPKENISMKDTIRTVAATAPMSAFVSTIKRVNVSRASTAAVSTAPHQVMHGTVVVDGLNIAYRKAGNSANPKLVLLHGFPASSHQYRNLVTALADRFHVIAPLGFHW